MYRSVMTAPSELAALIVASLAGVASGTIAGVHHHACAEAILGIVGIGTAATLFVSRLYRAS